MNARSQARNEQKAVHISTAFANLWKKNKHHLENLLWWTPGLSHSDMWPHKAMQKFVEEKAGCETMNDKLFSDSTDSLVCSITSPELYVTSVARWLFKRLHFRFLKLLSCNKIIFVYSCCKGLLLVQLTKTTARAVNTTNTSTHDR